LAIFSGNYFSTWIGTTLIFNNFILNCFLFFFQVLGFMSEKTGVEISKLAVGGPGLSFIGEERKKSFLKLSTNFKLKSKFIFDSSLPGSLVSHALSLGVVHLFLHDDVHDRIRLITLNRRVRARLLHSLVQDKKA
jgi:hypothetical protein